MRALAAIALLVLAGCGGGSDEPAREGGDLDRRLIEGLLELTLANGAVVDDNVNRLGWTALHEAVVLGDGDGRTALEHAEERGFEAIARILRSAPGP